MRISDWSSDVCSSDLHRFVSAAGIACRLRTQGSGEPFFRSVRLQQQRAAGGIAAEQGSLRTLQDLQILEIEELARTALVVCDQVGRQRHLGKVDEHAGGGAELRALPANGRSEEHTSELQSLMRNSYAVFCL